MASKVGTHRRKADKGKSFTFGRVSPEFSLSSLEQSRASKLRVEVSEIIFGFLNANSPISNAEIA